MAASVPVTTRKRDWFRILRDLMRVGVSMGDVARKCGKHPATVAKWAEGSEPKESDARVILALYAKHCPVQYLEHQRQFDIRVEIDCLEVAGEQKSLKFVG